MIDIEDIIDSLKNYLAEITENGKSRVNNKIDEVNGEKGDTLLNNIPSTANDIVLGQRIKEIKTHSEWLNIDIMGESKYNSAYDAGIKDYIVELSYIARDDFSEQVFSRCLRMERVLSELMFDYFKTSQEAGFIKGEIDSSFTPERVLLGSMAYKGIKSGIVYKFNIF